MPNFNYKARDKFGKSVQGIIGGESASIVAAKLREMGYTPITIHQIRQEESKLKKIFPQFNPVRFTDLNMFIQQFATLQKAGLPILVSLTALREQAISRVLKDVLGQIIRDIEAGASLSAALEKHPQIFNAVYINIIRSAEASGTLDQALDRLAKLGAHDEQVQLRIKAATRYPLLVLVAIVVAFFILISWVVPRFAELFGRMEAELPLPTRTLLGINFIVKYFWWLILLFAGGFILVFNRWINSKIGRDWWDNLKLKVPVFGPLMLQLTMSRFSRLVGTLLRSGIAILEVLELAKEAVGNAVVAKTVEKIKISVTEGKGLVEPMKTSGIFPPVVTQMVLVGEESGNIDELLLYVADYFDAQVDYKISNLIVLLEPMLILVLGCAVLLMALGIFLPMWNMLRLFT